MKVDIDTKRCDQCGTCISVCAKGALSLIDNLILDDERCVACGNCVQVCAFAALKLLG